MIQKQESYSNVRASRLAWLTPREHLSTTGFVKLEIGKASMTWLLVFLGGGLGAALRHGVTIGSAKLFAASFPFGTLIVNVTGSFVMGALAGYFAFKGDASQHWRLFLATGVLGGYTTFSAFSLDAMLLWERNELALAALYVGASVVLSILGLAAGLWLMRSVV